MKRINIYLMSALLMGTTVSCSDFLQKDPPSSPSQSIFWQKKSDFDSALAGTFSIMYEWPGEMSQIIPCFDNLTDNSICQHNEDTYGRSQTIALGDLDPNTTGFVTYMYSHCYTGIARAHLVMENLALYEGSDMTEDDKNFIMAQCKALRGYFYSWLYLCYKEVPLVTSSLTMENMYQPKSTRPEIYAQIMKDFDEAIAALPDKPYSDSQMSGYFSPGALKAFKARLMLNDAYDENGKAIPEKMKEIVPLLEEIQGYSLADRMRDNFISEKQLASPEIMFSVRYLAPNITHSMDLYYGNWTTCGVTRDLVDEFECTDGLKWGESPLTQEVDESLLSTNSMADDAYNEREKLFQNRDPRLRETVTHSGYATFPDEGYEDKERLKLTDQQQTGFGMMKYLQPTTIMPSYSTISDADVIILRYAEVLLMIAEAENEVNGPTQKVYDAVNAVRARSEMPPLPDNLSQDEMRERIRHEWRVEFVFEGQRYFQLKRWKLMEELVDGAVDPALPTYIKVFKPAFYYWPIPQTEIDKAGGVLVQDSNYK
ncbi:MAG: RagB/SusD family nutrient uptake outer membrane protein [Parabacteroides sp.]|uniref:RagB/SusD family nutrient uptake outer membrane protein n=1 Tax=Parabacteroides faecalis TaxID=2924040 RepID=A0ABT0C0Y3_9BACT|nr:RagB/SusD family nutrient uptake outer membrane protein [Parabacteroides faecalis]MCI7287091.1 RagB/SusD family nutrient uptake outer membrane protein [Parabacteroides sp.]MCJ2380649.1 RagB/SusD family nutrient uptake outer membrane protein [Parabacteroides faecalis]MDD7562123.1 RagB/SusD family nutrient uptake outer membrane protein [Parabacteroides sp.]MDY6255509.1 RagB/SusD family nutrient uptake outer membrane protein [Bacteroidales bacterium]